MHGLSCFVQLKRVLLISCVFGVFFQNAGSQLCFRIFFFVCFRIKFVFCCEAASLPYPGRLSFSFTTVLSHWDFFHRKIGLCCFLRGKRAATESRYSTYGACLVFISIINRPLIWTTCSLTCAQMLMHAIARGCLRTHERESAPNVDSGRKIPCRTGESNLRQRCDGPMLYQGATVRVK